MATSPASTPVAVVGVGCRLPSGVRDLDALWRALNSGRDVIRPVPVDRWVLEPCDPHFPFSRVGAFLDEIDRFDAAHFGITPDEAAFLDPQQRLLLEVAWEAMCDAGTPRNAWEGSRTAVLFGIHATDYQLLHARTLGAAGVGRHYTTGMEFSFAAGRLAYAFDLHGPAFTVNAACASSLLAVHQACQSLRAGECDTALAGGVTLMVTPDVSLFLASIGALSPTGQARPFEAAADGLVRGEGCGVVVLKRLDDALADADRIHAVLRGSAVTNDGRRRSLIGPGAKAQIQALRTALVQADLQPTEVDYVEASATGTRLGDTIELETLAEVYGAARTAQHPLYIGSLKAVFGHTEAAAGVLSLLKAIRVADARRVPGQPGLGPLNPMVNWASSGLHVPAAETGLACTGRPARAGVSSFGMSGSSVHLILEAAPTSRQPSVSAPGPERPHVLLASASHLEGLAEQVALLRASVARTPLEELPDLAASAAVRATHGPFRYAAVAADQAELMAALGDPLNPPAGAHTGTAGDPHTLLGPVFVYTGQSAQWSGTAVDLFKADDAARTALDECDALIAAEAGWSVIDQLCLPRQTWDHRTDLAQPTIFAVQVALTRALTAHGVTPTAVIGDSCGELAAAHACGALTLPEAVRVVVQRARLLRETAGRGPMFTKRTGNRLRDALAGLAPKEPVLRFVSSIEPLRDDVVLNAEYWVGNLIRPVQLPQAVDRLLADNDHLLVELGLHPILGHTLASAVCPRKRQAPVIEVLHPDRPPALAIPTTLARLHVRGITVSWERLLGWPGCFRDLPRPSWGGERYWLPGIERGQQNSSPGVGARTPAHPQPGTPIGPDTHTPVAVSAPIPERVEQVVRRALGLASERPLARQRNLFEQGLNSLTATAVQARLQNEFAVSLSPAVVFEHPTIDALAKCLNRTPEHADKPAVHSDVNRLEPHPGRGQSRHVILAAGRFHYHMWTTDRPSAVNVVLLHGGAGSVASWSRVGSALAAAGVTAFALDLRGHGGSVRPPPGSYGLAAAAGDVCNFITALHLHTPVLIGHCWGAAIALALATGIYHDRPPPNLTGLVLEDPPATLSVRENAVFLQDLQAAIRMPAETAAAIIQPHWHPADRESVLDGLRSADPNIAASIVHDGAASGPLLPLLARLTVPTLLLRADPHHGGMLTDTHWALINQLLPTGATAHHLPNTPHDIHRGSHPAFMHHLQAFLHTITKPK
jgi:acyl transferase domain-containing protein/pimeloyl-ACP methyl ester carboxylesterase